MAEIEFGRFILKLRPAVMEATNDDIVFSIVVRW